MSGVKCPVCGSDDTRIQQKTDRYTTPYGTAEEYQVEVVTCETCGEAGDFRDVNEAVASEAISKACKSELERILVEIDQFGISMAYLERALELPARTVARWKSGQRSAAPVALLRIVRTYPWILRVAADRFRPTTARKALLVAASETIKDAADSVGYEARVGTFREGRDYSVVATFSPNSASVPPSPALDTASTNAPTAFGSFVREGGSR